jgi:hypothetical protein
MLNSNGEIQSYVYTYENTEQLYRFHLLLTGVVNISMSARTAVVELMDTTALGMAENDKLARRPSARRISRFPD